jgi:uncharacterized protein (TIGR02231 family)
MNIALTLLTLLSSEAGIDRVVVYSDRAEVTRAAEAACQNGRASIALPLLPASIDERTLRATATGRAVIGSAKSRLVPRDPDEDARSKALEQELEQLTDQIRVLQDRATGGYERANGAVGFVPILDQVMREEIRDPKAAPDRWKKSIDAIASEEITGKKIALDTGAEIRKLVRKRERVEQRLAAARTSAGGQGRLVEIEVECAEEPRVKVEVSYVVAGATWRPEYDLRFFPASGQKVGAGKVELVVAGVVQQSTGEDWSDAKLVLSTAAPRLGGEAPQPAALWIDGYAASKDKVLLQATERRENLAQGGERRAGGPTGAALDDGGNVFTLSLPRRTTVRSDGRPYWIPFDRIESKGEAKLVAIPKLRPYVYQTLSLDNPAPYPLLSGRVHTHRGGSYVGDDQLRYVAPGEKIEVSLGLDEEIRIERIDRKARDRSPSFLGSMRRFEREYRIRIANRARGKQKLEVRENIPVSKDERIEVELEAKQTTAGHTLDKERGILVWTVDLAAGEERVIDFAYTIGVPKDWKM